jgi:PAS domain S-box-containing protein
MAITDKDAGVAGLRALSDAIDAGVIGVDGQGRVHLINDVAQRLLGWSAATTIGSGAHDLVHAVRERPGHDCPLLRVPYRGPRVRVDQDVFQRRDGSPLAD